MHVYLQHLKQLHRELFFIGFYTSACKYQYVTIIYME